MSLEIGLTDELYNTQKAPLGALLAHYQQKKQLKALEKVEIPMKSREFSPTDKIKQVLVSILAGCETMFEVESKLRPEQQLARICQVERFTTQSNLSRTLDGLTLMNIEQLREAVSTICQPLSQTCQHDWRGFLWLDFDLSGLPCSSKAQASQKGYFSGEKTRLGGNWLV